MSDDCPGGIQWILSVFGQCVNDARSMTSFVIGLSSLGCWLVAQFPQVLKNFKDKDVSGLSPIFLFLWLLGDSCNLVGALLTHQLATQVINGVYFLGMDFILGGQFIFYTVMNRRKRQQAKLKEKMSSENADSYGATGAAADSVQVWTPYENAVVTGEQQQQQQKLYMKSWFSLLVVVAWTALFIWVRSMTDDQAQQQQSQQSAFANRQLLGFTTDEPFFKSADEIVGYIIGCISAVLYLGSRIPQILKNCLRRSTEGLSPLMFFFAFMGNLTYTVSILIIGYDNGRFILKSLPWIVGSAGVLFLDASVLLQFILFRVILKRKSLEEIEAEEKAALLAASATPKIEEQEAGFSQ